jgi:type I restriction enzyme S subunit
MNVPKLRFPGFGGEWEEKKLGDIAKFSKGKGISKADIAIDGNLECIRYGELYTYYNEVIKEVKSKTNVDSKNLVLSKANDVIIPASGETQIDIATASCVTREGVALGGDLNIIKTSNDGVFLSYYLNNKKKLDIANLAQGISVVHLYAAQLSLLSVCVPTIPEQTKIASFLSAVDEKLQALKKKKELLVQYKQGVMQKIFTQEIRFKDDDGNEFEEWQKKKLGEISELTSSKRIFLSDYVKSGVPFYRGKEISELKRNIKPLDVLYIPVEVYEDIKAAYGVPKIGDLLITAVGTLGNVLGIKDDSPFYFKDGNLIWIRNIVENPDFLETLLEYYNDEIIKSSIGSSQKALTMVELRKLIFKFPCIEEQTKIANFLSAIDEKINHCQTQITATEQYKKALLQQMFV